MTQFPTIAQFALTPQQVPNSALEYTATLLIDTLGIAAGAADMDAGRIARDHAARFMQAATPDDAAPMLFDGRMTSLTGAGFALATQIDNLDGHDGYNPTKGHIGAAVVPALFAFAQHRPDLSGPDALRAMAMAYEIAARAAIALHATVSDYHTSGAWNALGVAALGCHLRGLDDETLRHAFGIAEYHGPRSQMMREIANPTMLHDGSGMGAMVGIMATLMAQDGFAGAPAITVEAPDVAAHWADLGQLWTVELNYVKPYPICRWAHGALDALALLMAQHDFAIGDIARIEVRTFAQSAALYPNMPTTTSQAQYSLAFALATLLRFGHIAPDHISGPALSDPETAALLPMFDVIEDARHSDRFPLGRWSDVRIVLKDGLELHSGDVHASGGPESPWTLQQVEDKFHTMTANTLPRARTEAIWAMRSRLLDPSSRFSELANLVTPPAGMGASNG